MDTQSFGYASPVPPGNYEEDEVDVMSTRSHTPSFYGARRPLPTPPAHPAQSPRRKPAPTTPSQMPAEPIADMPSPITPPPALHVPPSRRNFLLSGLTGGFRRLVRARGDAAWANGNDADPADPTLSVYPQHAHPPTTYGAPPTIIEHPDEIPIHIVPASSDDLAQNPPSLLLSPTGMGPSMTASPLHYGQVHHGHQRHASSSENGVSVIQSPASVGRHSSFTESGRSVNYSQAGHTPAPPPAPSVIHSRVTSFAHSRAPSIAGTSRQLRVTYPPSEARAAQELAEEEEEEILRVDELGDSATAVGHGYGHSQGYPTPYSHPLSPPRTMDGATVTDWQATPSVRPRFINGIAAPRPLSATLNIRPSQHRSASGQGDLENGLEHGGTTEDGHLKAEHPGAFSSATVAVPPQSTYGSTFMSIWRAIQHVRNLPWTTQIIADDYVPRRVDVGPPNASESWYVRGPTQGLYPGAPPGANIYPGMMGGGMIDMYGAGGGGPNPGGSAGGIFQPFGGMQVPTLGMAQPLTTTMSLSPGIVSPPRAMSVSQMQMLLDRQHQQAMLNSPQSPGNTDFGMDGRMMQHPHPDPGMHPQVYVYDSEQGTYVPGVSYYGYPMHPGHPDHMGEPGPYPHPQAFGEESPQRIMGPPGSMHTPGQSMTHMPPMPPMPGHMSGLGLTHPHHSMPSLHGHSMHHGAPSMHQSAPSMHGGPSMHGPPSMHSAPGMHGPPGMHGHGQPGDGMPGAYGQAL